MSDKKTITIEEGFDMLEHIILQMEEEGVSLEKLFELYNQGLELVKECNNKIDMVEKKIKLVEDADSSGEF